MNTKTLPPPALQNALDNPSDEATLLAADWLEEHGAVVRPRIMRLMVQAGIAARGSKYWPFLRQRSAAWVTWKPEKVPKVAGWVPVQLFECMDKETAVMHRGPACIYKNLDEAYEALHAAYHRAYLHGWRE